MVAEGFIMVWCGVVVGMSAAHEYRLDTDMAHQEVHSQIDEAEAKATEICAKLKEKPSGLSAAAE